MKFRREVEMARAKERQMIKADRRFYGLFLGVLTGALNGRGHRLQRDAPEGHQHKRCSQVRVVGRDAKKLAPFVDRATCGILGNVEDVASMTAAFNGASAVYLVLPEDSSQQDLRAHQERVSDSYAAAIANAHVRFVVNLSSIGG